MTKKAMLEIYPASTHPQGSDQWFDVRKGIVTASRFKDVLAKGEGKMKTKYLRQLAAEIITGKPMETYSNFHMERGNAMEAEARSFYELTNNIDAAPVGFIRRGDAGCSPDALIGDKGLLQIKTTLPELLIERLMSADADQFPPEHMAQCQGELFVSEREWTDLLIYWPGLPRCQRRLYRDDVYIRMLDVAVKQFNDELAELVTCLKAMT